MASMMTTHKLNTGASIPAVGFGTWQDKDAQEDAVTTALKSGYRHIDTAHIYGTEPAVGKGIRNSGIPRDQIFITTKLWNNAHEPKDVEKQLDASLQGLGVDYVDLFLMHWSVDFSSRRVGAWGDADVVDLSGRALSSRASNSCREGTMGNRSRGLPIMSTLTKLWRTA